MDRSVGKNKLGRVAKYFDPQFDITESGGVVVQNFLLGLL